MKLRRLAVIVPLALAFVMILSQVALAGEWGPGQGYNGAADKAQSECVFNGLDDPDPEDDETWAATPAKGKVQSGGQLIAAGFIPPGVQRFACNAHLNPPPWGPEE